MASSHESNCVPPEDPIDHTGFLAEVPIFASLRPADRRWVADRCVERVYSDTAEIATEGETVTGLYVVRSGLLRVSGRAAGNSALQVRFAEIGPGGSFADPGLIDGGPGSATVTTVGETHYLMLPAAACRDLIARSHAFAAALLHEQSVRLRETERQLAREAVDPLTGLAARRTLDYSYRRAAAGARRRGTGLTVVLVHLENLDAIIRAGGYLAGDEALRRLADILVDSARTADLIGRWGAEKFVLILPDVTPGVRRVIVDRIRESLVSLRPDDAVPVVPVARFGAAWSAQPPDRLETLVARADQDLAAGRRRYYLDGQQVNTG